jgi:hypothetical protein
VKTYYVTYRECGALELANFFCASSTWEALEMARDRWPESAGPCAELYARAARRGDVSVEKQQGTCLEAGTRNYPLEVYVNEGGARFIVHDIYELEEVVTRAFAHEEVLHFLQWRKRS